ncbi:MAG: YraN family protein [bacterium]
MRAKDAVGQYGERVAVQYLLDAGLEILERNWRCPDGELDIVARDGSTLVICEVKTRSSTAYGDPAEAVLGAKGRRLRRLTARWLAEHPGSWPDVRIDVITVLRRSRGAAEVEHFPAAV